MNVGEQGGQFESLKRVGDYMEASLMSKFRNRSSLWLGKTVRLNFLGKMRGKPEESFKVGR